MLASWPSHHFLQGRIVKKGVVVVLVLLAVIVLVSPAIVGHLAERSMDENLNWAAAESGEVTVTSEHFTRGWFSSEGQHRIELRDGELLTALQALAGPMSADDLPVLIINTHLDHGLIPLASMGRDRGSLAPGLGSAVSTLQVELPEGEIIDVPGTIYSKVALGGQLHSNYVLEAGSRGADGVTASWGDTDINVTTDPGSGEVVFSGTVGKLAFGTDDNAAAAPGQNMLLEGLSFEGRQRPTPFGFAVGELSMEIDDFRVAQGDNPISGLTRMAVTGETRIDDGDVYGDATMTMTMRELPMFGEMSLDLAMTLAGADAAALGRVQRGLESAAAATDPMAIYAPVEDDLKQLFASGFEFNVDKLDITLPQGTMRATLLFAFGEEDPANFDWTTLLLSTAAKVDLAIPAELVETFAQGNPQVAMVVGGGYLVKRGDDYVMEAEMKKGLLTVNGAPIPIPLGAP